MSVLLHHHHTSRAAMFVSAAETLQEKMESLIVYLEDPVVYYPGRLDDCMEKLRSLFNEEEILMIRSRYPDYRVQEFSHHCFLQSMLYRRKNGLFTENETCACRWLEQHEGLYGTLFRNYLYAEIPMEPEICRIPEPDSVMLKQKIL